MDPPQCMVREAAQLSDQVQPAGTCSTDHDGDVLRSAPPLSQQFCQHSDYFSSVKIYQTRHIVMEYSYRLSHSDAILSSYLHLQALHRGTRLFLKVVCITHEPERISCPPQNLITCKISYHISRPSSEAINYSKRDTGVVARDRHNDLGTPDRRSAENKRP